MPDDPTNAEPEINPDTSPMHEANGTARDTPQELQREVVLLRARCSNLRHWCRLMLEDSASSGVLPELTVTDLLLVSPEVSEPEGQIVVALLARGGNVPPNHPLAPSQSDTINLRATISQLNAEGERLRKSFFAL
jgi:hypothetical protein